MDQKKIGRLLRELRIEKNLTQEEFAEIIGVSELLSSMDEDIKDINTSTQETFSAISDMDHDLSAYRV